MLFLSVERIKCPAQGLLGALEKFWFASSGEELPSKGEFEIPAGERLIFETPGGGGYGDPTERDAEAVESNFQL